MGKNRYVGHRYIPIFENGWDKTRTYEPLTFVYYEGKTYVSRQLVPTNIEIENNDFWAFFMDNAPQIFTPTFTGQWEDKPYEPLSIVVNNGNTYVSKQDVPTGTVLTDTIYWLDLSTYYNQLFTDYETSEQERQQAESIRIENENQRKIDHVNRSAELAGKANKKQEDWLYPTITNGTVDISSTPSFYKDVFGIVRLAGRINNITGVRQTLFTLPVGYRPYAGQGFSTVAGGGSFGYTSVNNAGAVSLTAGNTSYLLLDGITFKAER